MQSYIRDIQTKQSELSLVGMANHVRQVNCWTQRGKSVLIILILSEGKLNRPPPFLSHPNTTTSLQTDVSESSLAGITLMLDKPVGGHEEGSAN